MRPTLAVARNIIVFALLLVVRPGQQGTLSALKDCIVQAGSNASDIVEHDGPDYAKYSELNYQWNLIHEKKFPVAYFVVRSVTDVQNAVWCCTAQSVRIVAKGGGHSYEAYSFGDSTALIVDLQALHELVVSPDRQSFTIGSGALLGQLAYPLLEGYNLVTPHGTCPTVGIAGLATGGGYGYLSKLFGLTTDNVMEVELVDANGDVLVVNRDTNPDLLWALRGAGGGNFGIITKLKFKAYSAPVLVTAGAKMYPLDQFPLVFLLWQQFVNDTYASRETNTKLAIKNGIVTVEVFDIQVTNDNVEEALRRVDDNLDKFPTTATEDTTQVIADPYMDFIFRTSHPDDVGITDPSQLPNVTRSMFSPRLFHAKSYFSNHLIAYDDIWTLYFILEETVQGVQDIIIEMYAFGGAIDDMSSTQDTAFNHRHGNLYLVQAFFNGKGTMNPNHPSIAWLNRFYEITTQVYRHTEAYQNYADATLTDHLQRYYGSNLDRLIQVKRNIDPRNIFHHPQSIPV